MVAVWPSVVGNPNADTRRDRDAVQAGLAAGTVPTNGTVKRATRWGSTRVDAVLQVIRPRCNAPAGAVDNQFAMPVPRAEKDITPRQPARSARGRA